LIVTKDKPHGEIIPTDDDESNRVWKFYGIDVFGAYRVMPKAVELVRKDADNQLPKELTKVRHAVKHPSGADSAKSIKDLVDLSISRLFEQMDMEQVSVVIPLGSTSKLNDLVAKKVKNKLPNCIVLDNFIKKNIWKNVTLSPTWHHEVGLHGGVPTEGTRRARAILERGKAVHPELEYEVKQVPRGLRRYFSSFFKIESGEDVDINKILTGAKILLIDDTLEEGSTMVEAIRVTKQFSPEKVMGYIFLWGRFSKA